MSVPFTSLADKEKEAFMEFGREYISDWDRQKALVSKCKHHYTDGRPAWKDYVVSRNFMRRVCIICDMLREYHWSNDQLAQAERNAADFAQPGSELWRKLYGDRTSEQVIQDRANGKLK